MTTYYYVPCAIQNCGTMSRGEDIWCSTCRRSLCRTHYDSGRHRCRYTDLDTFDTEAIDRRLRDLDFDRIQERAEILRPNHTCTVEKTTGLGSTYVAGGCNVHVRLVYDDGVEWFLRASFMDETPGPAEMLRRVRHAEYLTYKALDACRVAVPTPRSWGVGDLSKSQDPHFTYIIYDKLEGQRVQNVKDLDADKIPRMIESFARQNIKLHDARFDMIGSLDTDSSGAMVVGNMAEPRDHTDRDEPYFRGPFSTMREFYLDLIHRELQAIKAGQTFRQDPVMGYLIHLELRDLVRETDALDDSETDFFFRHPDSHIGNWLLQEDGQITGVLDWEWASTVCKAAAFAPPKWMWQTPTFWAGCLSLNEHEQMLFSSYEKLGRPDLAECVHLGKFHIRLEQAIGDNDLVSKTISPDPNYMLYSMRPLLANLHAKYKSAYPSTMVEWRDHLMAVHGNDPDIGNVQSLLKSTRKTRKPSWAYRIVPKRYWSMMRGICGEGTRG